MKLSTLALAALIALPTSAVMAKQPTDDAARKAIIEQSIRNYSGNCPCPYNSARNGSRCGKRSAYSRPGGASPLCYASDVTDDMVKRWKANQAR